MAFTYIVSTDIGKVRMMIPDRVEAGAIFEDEEIQAYLDMNDSSVRRAAADALEVIASDEAMTLKVITTLDLSTNGAATSDALLRRAKELRLQANEADGGDGGLLDYAEMSVNAFTARERVLKQALRDQ